MTAVGLTGGIGSGKSTVGQLLSARGALVVEADDVVHQLQRPGQPVFDAIARRFGDGVLTVDGALDRAALAEIVFHDTEARRELEAIVHPEVLRELGRLRVEAEARGDVIVLDVPLLAEAGPEARTRWGLDGIVVVDCPVDVAVTRLIELRGMTDDDARSRVYAQVSRKVRLEAADFVIDNSGDLAHLETEVDRCWLWVETLRS
ncbi:MAG TPA: dephospho-CoA kinase [Acidimicrobiales bacterium]|nr:dephospho-CoA kinase [Acidimicrobiales bacterium]